MTNQRAAQAAKDAAEKASSAVSSLRAAGGAVRIQDGAGGRGLKDLAGAVQLLARAVEHVAT